MSKDAKNVPTLRFRGYSDAWEKRKLGELANIRRGASPRPIKNKKWFSQTSQVGWIRISDVTEQNGRIHQVEQHLSDAGQKKTLVLKSKHLLLSIAATVGKPVQNYIQVGVHDGFIVFMDPKFDLDFMFYFLEKYRPNWARFGQPGSQININSELVRDLVVSIPTVHEQVAVAQFIITLDNLIAATQHRIDTLEHVKKALLQHVLDQSWRFKGFTDHWKRHKISDIFRVTRGKVLPTSSVANQKSLATPFPVYSSQTKHDGLLGYYHDYLYADAITWTTDGANAGMVKYRPQKFYSTNVNGVLISTQGYANTAVASILNTIAWKYVSHVGNPKLMGKVMADISLELPSIPEQKALSSLLENLNNTIRTTNVKLSKIQLLKSSLLQQLFI